MDGGGRRNDRGRGRGRHRYHRGGRGRGYRHQPYNNRPRYNNNYHNGGRGGGRPGNRFGAETLAVQDPQAVMIRQVFSFVSRVGEFKNIPVSAPTDSERTQLLRPVEATTAANINDLVTVLCSEDKLDVLFKFQQQPAAGNDNPGDKIGKLGHLVISCAASLPLQTPCYAALTLAVNEQIKGSAWEGFAARCVDCAFCYFANDLDSVLRTGSNVAQSACRMKLLLRYLAILGKVGVLKGYAEGSDQASDYKKLSVFGLLCTLVKTAKIAQERGAVNFALLLIKLTLSTVPYVMEYAPQEAIDNFLISPIEALLQTYKSTFTPGVGSSAILLKEEQDDGDSDDEDFGNDDDDDDDDDDNSGQVCDSLQDLLRVSKSLRDSSRFALPNDSPWKGLTQRINSNDESGEQDKQPISFSGETVYISVNDCSSFQYFLCGEGEFKILPFNLDGAIFGRLPIFGSAPEPDDEEDESGSGAIKNDELEAFRERFGLVDRFYVVDMLRDCLLSHETFLNPAGLQYGNSKSVAEELLSVCHAFSGDNPSQGMAYAIVEALFGLIAQSQEQSRIKHIYVSRVLLELTRLHPKLISPALVVAMTNLFEDYLPSLVPSARDNFSRWFAFHLTNTDYQWPGTFWQMLESRTGSTKPSSQGDFARRTIQLLVENLSDPSIVTHGCLSSTKSLANECFPRKKASDVNQTDGGVLAKFEAEIDKRVWDHEEDPTQLQDYILGEDFISDGEVDWMKTRAFVRVLVSPIKKIQKDLEDVVLKNEEDQMVDDTSESKDYYMIVNNAIEKYSKVIPAILAKEAEKYGDVKNVEALLLQEVETTAYFNTNIVRGLVNAFLKSSVVESMSVVRWALGDIEEGLNADIVSRWWVFATDAFDALDQSTHPVEGGESMIVDGSAAEISATGAREKVLTYTIKRVCSLLATKNEKRLNPMQVDLLEGMKLLAVKAKFSSDSDANISYLPELCCGFGGSVAVELLKSSLMQL